MYRKFLNPHLSTPEKSSLPVDTDKTIFNIISLVHFPTNCDIYSVLYSV